ncbi:MAG: hypothetical protein QF752_06770 [Planctomycetota bacterium]|jgi:hypothetical protein|nr:hypothetical protein [Planctomycetota bacterium]
MKKRIVWILGLSLISMTWFTTDAEAKTRHYARYSKYKGSSDRMIGVSVQSGGRSWASGNQAENKLEFSAGLHVVKRYRELIRFNGWVKSVSGKGEGNVKLELAGYTVWSRKPYHNWTKKVDAWKTVSKVSKWVYPWGVPVKITGRMGYHYWLNFHATVTAAPSAGADGNLGIEPWVSLSASVGWPYFVGIETVAQLGHPDLVYNAVVNIERIQATVTLELTGLTVKLKVYAGYYKWHWRKRRWREKRIGTKTLASARYHRESHDLIDLTGKW